MDPIDLANTLLFAASFALGIILLTIVALIGEAIAFAVGLGRRDWEQRY